MSPKARTMLTALATTAVVLVAVAALAAGSVSGLTLASHSAGGSALADSDGNFLYLFSNDAQGESKCYETCADNWPPLTTDGDVVAGEGIDADLIGTTTRTDGSVQVTYAGWPLYRFVGDAEPGMTAGQGLNDVWFLVSATGEPVPVGAAQDASTETADEAPASQDDLFAAYMDEGSKVFANICAACHGAQGNEELSTHVAILAGNSRVENARLVIRRVIHGGTYMPPFGASLSDREVAAVATFVRNSFGNEYGFVGEEEATAMR